MNCTSCNKDLDTDNDQKRELCFSCHVKSIRFGFVSVSHGRSSFHDSTIRETQRFYEDSPAFKEGRISKVPARQELI